MFSWLTCFFIFNNGYQMFLPVFKPYIPTAFSSQQSSQLVPFWKITNEPFSRQLDLSLTKLTSFLLTVVSFWGPSMDRCSPVCISILTVGWEMSGCFQTLTLGLCPLPNASERCRGPQTALSKQLCQNILCWWRLQSVTSSFLINWWGTAEFVSGVPLLARRWSF